MYARMHLWFVLFFLIFESLLFLVHFVSINGALNSTQVCLIEQKLPYSLVLINDSEKTRRVFIANIKITLHFHIE
jgi:hypothetical protein